MANEIEIEVTGRDNSKAAVDSATRSQQQLAAATTRTRDAQGRFVSSTDSATQATRKSVPATEQATQSTNRYRDSLRRTGETAAGVLTADLFQDMANGAKVAFTSTIRAATNLGESVNAVNVVFKDAAAGIHSLGKQSAQSVGLSTAAFNQAAVGFSAFASTVAGPGGDVVRIIDDLTTRAADFASVLNLDVNMAFEVMRSGLAGETEPLRKYGIDVSAATVETFAYANGIAQAGQQLTEAQKVQARYGVIMEQTAVMAGDFANTQDSAANAVRIAKAELENAQAVIGSSVLPVLALLASTSADILRGFAELPGPVQAVIGVLGLTSAAVLVLIPRIIALRASMAAIRTESPKAADGIGKVGRAAGGLMVVGAALPFLNDAATALENIGRSGDASIGGIGAAQKALADFEAGGSKNIDELVAHVHDLNNGWDQNAARILGLKDTLGGTEQDFRNLSDALAQLVAAGHGEEAETTFGLIREQLLGAGADADDVDRAFASLVDALAGAEAQAPATGAAVGEMGAATAEAAAEAEEAAAKIAEAWLQTLNDVTSVQTAYEDAMSAQEEAVRSAAEATAEATEDASDSWEDYAGAVDVSMSQVLDAYQKQIEAQENWATNVAVITDRAAGDVRDELVEMARSSPELAEEMVNATDEEWKRLEELARRDMGNATQGMQDVLSSAGPELRAISAQHGADVANTIARNMARNGTSVDQEARALGLTITRGVGKDRSVTVRGTVNQRSLAIANQQINQAARNRTSTITVQTAYGNQHVQAQATGGITGGPRSSAATGGARGGTDVLVGEHGPEIAELPNGTRVVPAGATQARLAGAGGGLGGGGEMRLVLELRSSGSAVDNWLLDLLRNSIRIQGGNVQVVLGSAA